MSVKSNKDTMKAHQLEKKRLMLSRRPLVPTAMKFSRSLMKGSPAHQNTNTTKTLRTKTDKRQRVRFGYWEEFSPTTEVDHTYGSMLHVFLSKHLRHEHSEKECEDGQDQGDGGNSDRPLLFAYKILIFVKLVSHRREADDGKDGQSRPVMETIVFVHHLGLLSLESREGRRDAYRIQDDSFDFMNYFLSLSKEASHAVASHENSFETSRVGKQQFHCFTRLSV
jgi:hypothetical protein